MVRPGFLVAYWMRMSLIHSDSPAFTHCIHKSSTGFSSERIDNWLTPIKIRWFYSLERPFGYSS